jgi:hypothetical protein
MSKVDQTPISALGKFERMLDIVKVGFFTLSERRGTE